MSAASEQQAVAEEFRDYAYRVSHDLGAPVRAMVEFSKLLSGNGHETFGTDEREFLSIIISNGRKLQCMMDGLLEYSRLNTTAKPFTTVDMRRVFETAATRLTSKIIASGAIVEAGPLPTLLADSAQMTRLFIELIDNALKFQPRDNRPHITVTAVRQGDGWMFSVADNGIGVEAQYAPRIFRMFQRLHTDDEFPGVGVGLTLAQKIVQRHHGDITTSMRPDGGSVFSFFIPDRQDGWP